MAPLDNVEGAEVDGAGWPSVDSFLPGAVGRLWAVGPAAVASGMVRLGVDCVGETIFSETVLYRSVVRLGSEALANAWAAVMLLGPGDGSSASTSSASRYHFRRRVHRPQPSWPRRPFCHYLL